METFDPNSKEHTPVEEVKINFNMESWIRQTLSNLWKNLNQKTKIPQNANSETRAKSDDYGKRKEIINISSDSEYENAEQKIENALLWKLRPPKKCSSSNNLESFDENMSSTKPCFFIQGNERSSGYMSSGKNYMAKHSSNIPNPSKPIPSFIPGQKPVSADEAPKQGMSLLPRLV